MRLPREEDRIYELMPAVRRGILYVYYLDSHHIEVSFRWRPPIKFTVREWTADHDTCLARIALECP